MSVCHLPRWGKGWGGREAEEATLFSPCFWEVTAVGVCYKIFLDEEVKPPFAGEKGPNISFSHFERFVPVSLKNLWRSSKRSSLRL